MVVDVVLEMQVGWMALGFPSKLRLCDSILNKGKAKGYPILKKRRNFLPGMYFYPWRRNTTTENGHTRLDNPINYLQPISTILFCNTLRSSASHVAEWKMF